MRKTQSEKERVWLAKDVQSRWQTAYNCAFGLLGRILQGKSLSEINKNRKVILELANYFASQISQRIGFEFDKVAMNDFELEKKIKELLKQKKLREKEEEEINKLEF